MVRAVPDARLVILGQGELHEALVKQVHQHGLEKHVLLPGFRTDVLSLMKTADIFVMSSVMEGLGTSLLDAMACARPIVATDTGGIPEVVLHEETGLLVPPRDAGALADALVTAARGRGPRPAVRGGGLRACPSPVQRRAHGRRDCGGVRGDARPTASPLSALIGAMHRRARAPRPAAVHQGAARARRRSPAAARAPRQPVPAAIGRAAAGGIRRLRARGRAAARQAAGLRVSRSNGGWCCT